MLGTGFLCTTGGGVGMGRAITNTDGPAAYEVSISLAGGSVKGSGGGSWRFA